MHRSCPAPLLSPELLALASRYSFQEHAPSHRPGDPALGVFHEGGAERALRLVCAPRGLFFRDGCAWSFSNEADCVPFLLDRGTFTALHFGVTAPGMPNVFYYEGRAHSLVATWDSQRPVARAIPLGAGT